MKASILKRKKTAGLLLLAALVGILAPYTFFDFGFHRQEASAKISCINSNQMRQDACNQAVEYVNEASDTAKRTKVYADAAQEAKLDAQRKAAANPGDATLQANAQKAATAADNAVNSQKFAEQSVADAQDALDDMTGSLDDLLNTDARVQDDLAAAKLSAETALQNEQNAIGSATTAATAAGETLNQVVGEAVTRNNEDKGVLDPEPPTCFKKLASDTVFPTFQFGGCTAVVGTWLLKAFALVLWVSGIFLNQVITTVLEGMNSLVTKIDAVNTGWRVLRDLANMLFIFVLLYAGISTMLQMGANTKKLIVNVIVIALFINFSLFLTKAVIDASNITALFFYHKIIPVGSTVDQGLSDTFMKALKIQSIYNIKAKSDLLSPSSTAAGDTDLSKKAPDSKLGVGNIIIFTFGGCILFVITAFIFFAAGVLFLLRFVVLILLMVFSPLAFIAYALPGTKSYFSKWWDMLLKNAFFAPAYMLIIYLTVLIINGGLSSKIGGTGSFTDALSGDSSAIGIILNFVIVITLLTSSLLVAKSAGAKGAVTVSKWGSSTRKFAQGKLARTAVRATGVNMLEKSLDKGVLRNFGNLAPIRGLRSVTTGALIDQKFGSKESIKSMDKKYDKFVDKRTEQKEEDIAAKVKAAEERSKQAKDRVKNTDEELSAARTFRSQQTDPVARAKADAIVREKEQQLEAHLKAAEKARTPVEKAQGVREDAQKQFDEAEAYQRQVYDEHTDEAKRNKKIDEIEDDIERRKVLLTHAQANDPDKVGEIQRAIDESELKLKGYTTEEGRNEMLRQADEVAAARKIELQRAEQKVKDAPDEIRNEFIEGYGERKKSTVWFKSLARKKIVEGLRKKKKFKGSKGGGGSSQGGGKPDPKDIANQLKDADFDDVLSELDSEDREKLAKKAKPKEETEE